MAGLPGDVPAPRRCGNALEQSLRLATPHRPPRGSKGRHRRRCALPVPRTPATPQPPPGDSADRVRSCRLSSCTAPVTGPLLPFLPSCKRLECNAAGLLRQDPSARRAPAGRLPRFDRSRGQEGVSGGPRCWRTTGRRPCACRGTGDVHACRTRRRRGLAGSAGAACPPTPRASLRSQGRSSGLLLAGLCAADRDAVEGVPWPGRRRGWTQLGSRSPGLRLAAAVLPA